MRVMCKSVAVIAVAVASIMPLLSCACARPKDRGLAATPPAPCAPQWAIVLEANPDEDVVMDPAVRQRIIETGLPWRVKDISARIEMVLVPPGEFAMGNEPAEEFPSYDEVPVHKVRITNPFYLARTELTQAQWSGVMVGNPSAGRGASRPVESVSWAMVDAYCRRTGVRLPTESEWEYACRLGLAGVPWRSLESIAWYAGDSGGSTQCVAQMLPNGLGIYDMLGNVSEWCSDWYGPYGEGAQVDPTGPARGSVRVLRGGAYSLYGFNCRPTQRHYTVPSTGCAHVGFRPARSL